MPEHEPTSAFIDIMRTIFPVVALQPDDHGQAVRPDFFGTAFAVGPQIFITAAHVASGAAAKGILAIGGPTGDGRSPLGAARVIEHELFPDRDLAILKCNVRDVTLLNTWLASRVQLLTDVSSFGYPHAVTANQDGSELRVVFRGYKGSVITIREFERLPDEPAVYEVQTPFPQGMSGAPLLYTFNDTLMVAGVVLGTSTVEYGGVPQNVGIAMVTDEIAELHSTMLGGPIFETLGLLGARLERRRP